MASPPPASAKPNPQSKPQPKKGILKKPSGTSTSTTATTTKTPQTPQQPTTNDPQPALTRQELAQRQELAARQRLLQKLKEADLLKDPVPIETFELLSQFPRAADRPASSPSEEDAAYLLRALADFQPNEYLDLIEERNCLGKCGYALCPRPRRQHEGSWKIRSSAWSSSPFSSVVARTEDLNKWCSDACALRAMHLKVQLDNPSYIRVEEEVEEEVEEKSKGGRAVKVTKKVKKSKLIVKLELREESTIKGSKTTTTTTTPASQTKNHEPRGTQEDRDKLAAELAQLDIDDQKRARKNAAALASERGDPGGVFAGVTRVEVTIADKDIDGPVEAPSLELQGTENMIEGYQPRSGAGKKARKKPARGGDDGDDDNSSDDDDGYDVFDKPMKGTSLQY